MTVQTQNPRITHFATESGVALHIRQFLKACTVRDLDDSDVLPVADLYGMYMIWCEHSEAHPVAIQAFSTLLRAEGIDSGISRRERVFKGIVATGPIPVQYILETDKSPGPNSTLDAFSF